jgi:hypothetical protein
LKLQNIIRLNALVSIVILLINTGCVVKKSPISEEKDSDLPIITLTGVIGDYNSPKQIMDNKGTIHNVFLGLRNNAACMLDTQVPRDRPDRIATLRLNECTANTVSEISLASNDRGDLSFGWFQDDKEGKNLIIHKYNPQSDWMSPAIVPLQSDADHLSITLDDVGNLLAVWEERSKGGFIAAHCNIEGKCKGVPGLRIPDNYRITHADIVSLGIGDFMLLWQQNDEQGNFEIWSGYYHSVHGFRYKPILVAKGVGEFSGTWMSQVSTRKRIVVAWVERNIYVREFIRETGWNEPHKIKEMYNSPYYTNLGVAGDDVVVTWKYNFEGSLHAITSKTVGVWERETYFGDEHQAQSLLWPKMVSLWNDSLSLFWVEEAQEIWGNTYTSRSGWSGVNKVNREGHCKIDRYQPVGNGSKSALLIFPSIDYISGDVTGECDSLVRAKLSNNMVRKYSDVIFAVQYME